MPSNVTSDTDLLKGPCSYCWRRKFLASGRDLAAVADLVAVADLGAAAEARQARCWTSGAWT